MIKILDRDEELKNKTFFKECSRCSTKFTYQHEDTHRDLLDFFENDGDRHVICPFCGSREWANYEIYIQPKTEKDDE